MLATLARRYRVAYSVVAGADGPVVTHSTGVYLFDAEGSARAILTGLDGNADLDAAAAAIRGAERPRTGSMWIPSLGR